MVPTATNKSRFQIEVTGYILDEKSLVKKVFFVLNTSKEGLLKVHCFRHSCMSKAIQ